jgi:hypothetical protein
MRNGRPSVRCRVARALVAALLVAGCSSAATGRAQAEADIAEGRARLRVAGFLDLSSGPIDGNTGLLIDPIGCCVTEGILDELRAYNGAVLAALREGRLKGQTFDDKIMTREAVEARFANEAALTIAPNAPPVVVAGSRFAIEIAPYRLEPPIDRSPWLFATDVTTGERGAVCALCDSGRSVAVLVEHQGTTLLVRCRDGEYETFDLPQRTLLQRFARPR